MLECACACDGESEGIFAQYDGTSREYRTCSECNATIWPWERHRIGHWWDCEACDNYDYDTCDQAGADEECAKGRDTDSDNYMCKACSSACRQLLCDCWWVGNVWEHIANQNDMTVAECLGEQR